MVNVVNKMCEVPNCFKRPSLNYPGIRPAVRCGEHKLEGMTNAFRKATVPKSSNKQASSNGSQTRTRVKSSDGDTTDSGSDEDESSPVSLESGTGNVASPTAKPAPGQFSRAFFFAPSPPNWCSAAETAATAKPSRSGSGVAAQRAALASLQVAVDEPSSVSAACTPAPASAKSLQSKDILKLHLCQVRISPRHKRICHLPAISRPSTLYNRSSPRPGSAGWSKPCRSTVHPSLTLFL